LAPELPTRPYLKPWYRLGRGESKLVLEYGHSSIIFEGRATERLLPSLLALLDGTHTLAEIETMLGEAAAPAVRNALQLLCERRLLTEGPPLDSGELRPVADTVHFLAAAVHGSSIASVREALATSLVGVLGTGPIATEVIRALQLAGVRTSRTGWDDDEAVTCDLVIAAPSGDELSELGPWNRRALDTGTAWLQLLPFDGRIAAIGPLFVPFETCCYECYRLRRLSTIDYPDEHELLENVAQPAASATTLNAAIAGIGGTIALRWLVAQDHFAPGTLSALETAPYLSLAAHSVYRVPRCQACSPVRSSAQPLPWHKEVAA
jgi:bacteriocin biosynthesis cyclodehydratase domain-containing protein